MAELRSGYLCLQSVAPSANRGLLTSGDPTPMYHLEDLRLEIVQVHRNRTGKQNPTTRRERFHRRPTRIRYRCVTLPNETARRGATRRDDCIREFPKKKPPMLSGKWKAMRCSLNSHKVNSASLEVIRARGIPRQMCRCCTASASTATATASAKTKPTTATRRRCSKSCERLGAAHRQWLRSKNKKIQTVKR